MYNSVGHICLCPTDFSGIKCEKEGISCSENSCGQVLRDFLSYWKFNGKTFLILRCEKKCQMISTFLFCFFLTDECIKMASLNFDLLKIYLRTYHVSNHERF